MFKHQKKADLVFYIKSNPCDKLLQEDYIKGKVIKNGKNYVF